MQYLSAHPRADERLGEVSYSTKLFWSLAAQKQALRRPPRQLKQMGTCF